MYAKKSYTIAEAAARSTKEVDAGKRTSGGVMIAVKKKLLRWETPLQAKLMGCENSTAVGPLQRRA